MRLLNQGGSLPFWSWGKCLVWLGFLSCQNTTEWPSEWDMILRWP